MQRHLFYLAPFIILVISSCGMVGHTNFNRQKFTSLRPISTETNQETTSNINHQADAFLAETPDIKPIETVTDTFTTSIACDTIVLKTGELMPVQIKGGSAGKVYYTSCGNDTESWRSVRKRKIESIITQKDPYEYGIAHLNGHYAKNVGLVLFLTGILLFTVLLLWVTEVLPSVVDKLEIIVGASTVISLPFGFMLLMFSESYEYGSIAAHIRIVALLTVVTLVLTLFTAVLWPFGLVPFALFVATAIAFIVLALVLLVMVARTETTPSPLILLNLKKSRVRNSLSNLKKVLKKLLIGIFKMKTG